MPSIFEKLANGEISVDNSLNHNDPKYKQAADAVCAHEKKLLETLNDEEKAVFKKLTDAQLDAENASIVSSFAYGYKLGVVLTAEAFTRL